jgi:hypothetical protein
LPFLIVILSKWPVCGPTRVVDQNVNSTESVLRFSNYNLRSIGSTDVGGNSDRPTHAMLFAQIRYKGVNQFLPARNDDDVSALARKDGCYAAADAGGGSGYYGSLVL